PDVVIECTGAATLVVDTMNRTSSGGIVCLAGVSSGGHTLSIDVGLLNRSLVLENDVIFGSVNANRRHYEAAAQALARADRVRLVDFMPRRSSVSDLIRLVIGVRGYVAMRMELILRFDYGATVPWVTRLPEGGGIRAIAGPDLVVLRTPTNLRGVDKTTVSEF